MYHSCYGLARIARVDDEKRMRSDAVRNRERVLAAADVVFSRQGLSASVADVAAAAGVGVGTIYRGFGTKGQLVDALYAHRMEKLLQKIAGKAAETTSAGAALQLILRALVRAQISDRGLQDLVNLSSNSPVEDLKRRWAPGMEDLIRRAKLEGALREDFSPTDVPAIVAAALALARHGGPLGSRLAQRHLELIMAGVFQEPDPQAVPAALTADEYAQWARAVARDWHPDRRADASRPDTPAPTASH